MGKASNMKALMGMLTMAAMADGINMSSVNKAYERTPETEEQKKIRLEQAKKNVDKSNGLKEFKYGDNTLLALNQKNADKKAKKLGWL